MSTANVAAGLGVAHREGHGTDAIERTADDELALQACVERVRALKQVTSENLVKIGKELIFARGRLGYGRFGNWLRANALGISDRTARRYMQLAEWADSNSDTVSVLEPTAAYLLSAPSTPACVTSNVKVRLARGEAVPIENVRALIKVARSERSEANGKVRSAQRRRARARAKGERHQIEDHEEKGRAAATEFARLLRHRVDDIRASLAELLTATNGAALLNALKTELGLSSSALFAREDPQHVPATSPMLDMPEIPLILRRVSQPPVDQPA